MGVSERELGTSVPVTEVLNPGLWRDRYAYGVLLGAIKREWQASGKPGDPGRTLVRTVDELPPDTIRWHLRAALSEVELKIGVPMGVVICKAPPFDATDLRGKTYDRQVPRLPFHLGEHESWWKIQLPAGVLSVERVRGYYYGNTVWEFSEARGNLDQLHLEWPGYGGVHVMPSSLTSIVISSTGQVGVLQQLYINRVAVPDFWAVDYTLGPGTWPAGLDGHIPAAVADWCYCVAGQKLLNLASMSVSKGVSSSSVSMDGVSRSVNLQASAMYGMNSALERVYKEASERIDWKALALALRGIRVRSYS